MQPHFDTPRGRTNQRAPLFADGPLVPFAPHPDVIEFSGIVEGTDRSPVGRQPRRIASELPSFQFDAFDIVPYLPDMSTFSILRV